MTNVADLLIEKGLSRERLEECRRAAAISGESLDRVIIHKDYLPEEDVLEAIADDLRLALRELTGPARAAVEVVDVGKLDDLLEHPLQLQLFATFRALSSAHLYLATISKAEEVIERARGRASG